MGKEEQDLSISLRWDAAVQGGRDVADGVPRFELVLAVSFGVEDLAGSSDEVWLAEDESETEDDRCVIVLAKPVCLRQNDGERARELGTCPSSNRVCRED